MCELFKWVKPLLTIWQIDPLKQSEEEEWIVYMYKQK